MNVVNICTTTLLKNIVESIQMINNDIQERVVKMAVINILMSLKIWQFNDIKLYLMIVGPRVDPGSIFGMKFAEFGSFFFAFPV